MSAFKPYNHISLDQIKTHDVIFVARTYPPIDHDAIKILCSQKMVDKVKSYKSFISQAEVYEASLKMKPVSFTIRQADFDWNTLVPIRILYDSKLPFNLHNGVMVPMKPVDNDKPNLNEGMDPLVAVKLSNKKFGLIYPNSATPVDVSCQPAK